jgi:hypothetical protein
MVKKRIREIEIWFVENPLALYMIRSRRVWTDRNSQWQYLSRMVSGQFRYVDQMMMDY